MEAESSDNNNSTEGRSSNRKAMLQRKKIVDGLIKSASSVNDPLDSFPDFRHFNQRGLCCHLEARHGARLSRIIKQYVQKLLKENMERHYGTEWPAEEKMKYREINAAEARYILAYKALTAGSNEQETLRNDDKGDIVGFVHYRFTLEEDLPVLYVYELQLEENIQGKGLGRFLMQLLELIAQKSGMVAMVLTVQKRNMAAMSLYTAKLGYSVAGISPSRVDPVMGAEVSYEILCKAFNQEARSTFEEHQVKVITVIRSSKGRKIETHHYNVPVISSED